jgi:hypothetical protein
MRGLRKIVKRLSAVVVAFGVIAFPLTVWSTADFASRKGWLWRTLADLTQTSPWIPALLVVAGAGAFGWMVVLDRRFPASGSWEPESIRDHLHSETGPLFPRPGDAAFREDSGTAINARRWRSTYEFRHDARYGHGVTIRLESLAGEEFAYFVCRVTNPQGEVAEGRPKSRGLVPVARPDAAIHYPGQFRGMHLLPPGQYVVDWYGLAGLRPDSGRVLISQASFMVHEGRLIP